ncbi:MAG TPA: hypothetical protein VLI39_02010 [Sedimentisphaerales bacterium]|nr:hypothetical protein [Sedimentisphaerales bacterium]
MATQRIEDLLKTLARQGIERTRPGLAQEIKDRIPRRLIPTRADLIGLIAHLRINRFAAAATILVAFLVVGGVLGGREAIGKQMFEDSRLLLQYTLGGQNVSRSKLLESLMRFRDDMAAQGREVVYYGDQTNSSGRYAIVMYWKLSDDKYGVVLGDLSVRTVSGEMLIRLQSHMLQGEAKK